jgi:hypothetical protein
MQAKREDAPGGGWIKVLALVLILCGIAAIGWATLGKYFTGIRQGAPMARVGENGARGAMPSPDQMRANMETMMTQVGLSDAQKDQIRAIWKDGPPKNREEMQARRVAMEKVATPEQQAKFRTLMGARMGQRMAEMQKKLPPEDFAALQKRIKDLQASGHGPGGPGMGGPPAGPPPDAS